MKGKKTLRCICCGEYTLHRFKGWWIHKHCLEELQTRLSLIKYELPNIQRQLMFGNRRLLESTVVAYHNGQTEKLDRIGKDVRKKAWELMEEKYGKPSWMSKEVNQPK